MVGAAGLEPATRRLRVSCSRPGNRSQGNAVAEEADDIRAPAFEGAPPRAGDPNPADGVRS